MKILSRIFIGLLLGLSISTNVFSDEEVTTDGAADVQVKKRSVLFKERSSDPATPAANGLRLYAKDTAGTSGLYIKDDAGTVIQVGSGGGGGSGDIDSVTAGSGLTGGGISGAVTLNVGAGTAMDVNADDIAWDSTEVTNLTWSDGLSASLTHTVNLSGTDPVWTYGSGTAALTGSLSATNLSGTNTGDQTSVTGNAGTATALAADPNDCSASNFATTIAANGNLTCAQPAFSDLSGSATDAQIPDTITASNYQPLDSDLTTIAGLTATTDNFMVAASSAWASRTPAQARTSLGLVIGTNVEAWDADLDYLAGFTPSANVKTILNAADYAAIRTALGLVIGTNVQAYDADLGTWAGITPGANVGTFLGTPSSTNLASAITDETGSGLAVFGTSPTITTPTVSGTATLAENASVGLDPAGSADGKYTGLTVTATAGYTQAFGDLVYLDPTDSRWEAVDANSAAGADGDGRGLIGMVVVAGTDGNACTILLNGIIRADAKFPSFTINNPIYASETAGSVTQTQPTTTDVVIRIVGSALTADEMYFNPSADYITHT